MCSQPLHLSPTLSMILKLPDQICACESSMRRQLIGIWAFAVVVCGRFGKHLHCCRCTAFHVYIMSHCYNSKKRLCSSCSASHFIILSFNFIQRMICRAQQSEIPTIIICNLHQYFIVGSSFYATWNTKRSIGEKHRYTPLWRHKFKKIGGTIRMLQWPPSHMMGGDPVSGAMMPPWRHACIQAPWDGLSLHVTWM